LVRIPEDVNDDQAILLSDILPTAYFAAELAHPHTGSTVAVFGCGPVGLLTIMSLHTMGVGRIFAVDCIESRLELARQLGAEVIDFDAEHPVETILRLTGSIGVDRAIDCVGIDAVHAHAGPAKLEADQRAEEFQREVQAVAPEAHPSQGNWEPGDAPSQAQEWAVDALAKAGTLSIAGVYPQTARFFPIGKAMMKNLTLRMGNCHHRAYIPKLLQLVRGNVLEPTRILTQRAPVDDILEAYRSFDRREPSWVKVALRPAA